MNSGRPRIAVMQLGTLPAELAGKWPDYGQMIIDWLSPALPEAEYRTLSIIEGEPLPLPDTYDGVVYSGSRHGVYDDLPWIKPLKAFVAANAALARPQFGICFGHQLIAQTLGGKAQKFSGGWSCGVQRYELETDSGSDLDLNVLVMHQDQVLELPAGAKLLGGSELCRNGVVDYSQAARSVQFHPEFSADYVAELLRIYGGGLIPLDVAESAAASLRKDLDQNVVAEWAARFFREHFPARDEYGD